MIEKKSYIIITGAAGSLGTDLIHHLQNNGKHIIAIDINEEVLSTFDSSIPSFVVDLTNPEKTSQIFEDVIQSYSVEALINNAGIIHSELLFNFMDRTDSMHSVDTFDKIIQSNLHSTFLTSRMIANYFISNRLKGNIINISSISAQGNLGQTAYAAAKAGVEAMTKVWAKELGRFKIRVNAIAPGFIDTLSTHKALDEKKIQLIKKETPLGRLGHTKHIAQTVEYILGNDFVNGQVIGVDGGLTVHS